MIRTITSGSQYITIDGGSPSLPYISPGAIGAGMLRYNPNMQQIEVSDGVTWLPLTSTARVDLGYDTKQAVEWAHNKMQEEKKLKEMMDRHPGLKDLHDKFEMMKVLCMEEEKQ
jgi:hypothetical protein